MAKKYKTAKDFYNTHMVIYKPREVFRCCGWNSVEMLEFLKGRPWDDISLAYVHALRPSSIRVTEGTTKADARVWRVTVYIGEDNIIKRITQEVEVGLPNGTTSGESLNVALKYGIDSPQAKWYDDDDIIGFLYSDKLYKQTNDGSIPFPENDEESNV